MVWGEIKKYHSKAQTSCAELDQSQVDVRKVDYYKMERGTPKKYMNIIRSDWHEMVRKRSFIASARIYDSCARICAWIFIKLQNNTSMIINIF